MSLNRCDFKSITSSGNDIKYLVNPHKNAYPIGKNYKTNIFGMTQVKCDGKLKKINLFKIFKTLYGETYAKHYFNEFKVSPHLSFFSWPNKFARLVIYSAMLNHTKHYEELKRLTKVCLARLILPASLKNIDLTPILKKNDGIELSIEVDNDSITKRNIDWKGLFKLYVLFKMGNLNRPELEWTPDIRFERVKLIF